VGGKRGCFQRNGKDGHMKGIDRERGKARGQCRDMRLGVGPDEGKNDRNRPIRENGAQGLP
jgi:hypothetical protein